MPGGTYTLPRRPPAGGTSAATPPRRAAPRGPARARRSCHRSVAVVSGTGLGRHPRRGAWNAAGEGGGGVPGPSGVWRGGRVTRGRAMGGVAEDAPLAVSCHFPHLSRTRRPRPLSTADLVPAAGAPDRAGVFSTHFTLGTRDFLYLRTCSSNAAPHLSCRREHGLDSSEAQLQNVHERRVRGVRYDLEPSALRPESLSGRQVVLGAGGLGQNVLEPPA